MLRFQRVKVPPWELSVHPGSYIRLVVYCFSLFGPIHTSNQVKRIEKPQRLFDPVLTRVIRSPGQDP